VCVLGGAVAGVVGCVRLFGGDEDVLGRMGLGIGLGGGGRLPRMGGEGSDIAVRSSIGIGGLLDSGGGRF